MENKYKLVAFDLDGTLATSKQSITKDMAVLLDKLCQRYYVLVVSGGKLEQFQKQLLSNINANSKNGHLYIGPTSGGSLFEVLGDDLKSIYEKTLSEDVFEYVKNAYFSSCTEAGVKLPDTTYGEVAEYRISQISFSPFGQEAPYEIKKGWDTNRSKRVLIREKMLPKIGKYNLDILIGGTSTIDVVQKGVDKAFVLGELSKRLNISKDEVLYIGDAVFPGGNDYAPKEAGYECINVIDVEDTAKHIHKLTA